LLTPEATARCLCTGDHQRVNIEHDPQKAVDDSRKNQRAAAAPRGTDERD
jgi:hypothetical protein